MQAAAAKLVNMPDTQTVTCDCGVKYQTRVVKVGPREYRHHPMCPQCTSERTHTPRQQSHDGGWEQRWRNICPPGYQDTVPARLGCGMSVIARVEQWTPAAGRGLLITGDSGRGKTRLMWLAARQLCRAGVCVGAIDDPTLSVSYSDALGRGEGMDFIADLLRPSVLLWDDFGKAKASDRYRELAYIIIEKRMAALKPMIVTTQLDGGDSNDIFGDRDGSALVRRLRECCRVVTV